MVPLPGNDYDTWGSTRHFPFTKEKELSWSVVWHILLFSLLFVTLSPFVWSRYITDQRFWKLQSVRLMIGLMYAFLVFYVFLIDQTPTAYMAWFGWVVAIGLIVDFILFGQMSSAFLGGVMGVIILFTIAYMTLIYPYSITQDKYEFTQAERLDFHLEPTSDQPLPVVPKKHARYKMEKMLEESSDYLFYSIGEPTTVKQNDHLYWVAPVEHQGVIKWWRSRTVPGYLTVSAEDPERDAELIEAEMRMTPSAFFDDHLFRQVRLKYPDLVLVHASFEPDDNGKPYYAVSYGRYTKFRDIRDIQGIILVDPVSGSMKSYPLQRVPAFVDQIFPAEIAWERNEWLGLYQHGFWNSLLGKRDLHRPTDELAAVFSGKERSLHWVTDHTPEGEDTGSMAGYTFFNSRTGTLTYFTGMNDMISSGSAIQLMEKTFSGKAYQGGPPLLYNLYGEHTWFVPGLDDDGVLRQIFLVNAREETVIGFGESRQEALNQYQHAIQRKWGPGNNTDATQGEWIRISGKVEAVYKSDRQDETLIQFILEEEEPIFSVRSSLLPYAIFLEPGHRVDVEYLDSGETTVAVKTLKNKTLQR